VGTNLISDRIIGYILFIAGILLILYSAFNVYKVFTKGFEPVRLFEFQGIGLDAGLRPVFVKLIGKDSDKIQ